MIIIKQIKENIKHQDGLTIILGIPKSGCAVNSLCNTISKNGLHLTNKGHVTFPVCYSE